MRIRDTVVPLICKAKGVKAFGTHPLGHFNAPAVRVVSKLAVPIRVDVQEWDITAGDPTPLHIYHNYVVLKPGKGATVGVRHGYVVVVKRIALPKQMIA